MNDFSMKKIMGIGAVVLFLVVAAICGPLMFEDNDANNILVIQSPSGQLRVVTEPGWTWQGFGSVTTYPRRVEFKFGGSKDDAQSPPLNIRFYDGGSARLSGSISWMMPADPASIIKIHRDFHSAEAFETMAIRRSMESAATFSGPTMTSFESAAGRRAELMGILSDQTLHGVYQTISKTIKSKDVTGAERDSVVMEIVRDEKGAPKRAQESYVEEYKAQMQPLTITSISYEDRVEKQIQDQQAATNAVAVAAANAKRADQDAITAEAQGRATVAKAKAEQETLNAKTIADAQARVTIAEAQVKEAEAFKQSEILRGEGEAARKKAVMAADGQLDKRLEAYVQVNKMYADAIGSAKPGAWSPQIVMGKSSDGSNTGNSATALVDMLTARTAKQISVDLGVGAPAATK